MTQNILLWTSAEGCKEITWNSFQRSKQARMYQIRLVNRHINKIWTHCAHFLPFFVFISSPTRTHALLLWFAPIWRWKHFWIWKKYAHFGNASIFTSISVSSARCDTCCKAPIAFRHRICFAFQKMFTSCFQNVSSKEWKRDIKENIMMFGRNSAIQMHGTHKIAFKEILGKQDTIVPGVMMACSFLSTLHGFHSSISTTAVFFFSKICVATKHEPFHANAVAHFSLFLR